MRVILGILCMIACFACLFIGGWFFAALGIWNLYQDAINHSLTFWSIFWAGLLIVGRAFLVLIITGILAFTGIFLITKK